MEVSASAHAAALWAGAHLTLLLVLAVLVVRQRRLHHVVFGDGGQPSLVQAIRAFGNATEYVPSGLVGIAILAFAGASPMVVHVMGVTLFAGRVAHAVGLSRSGEVSILRTIGIVATWLAYLATAVALLFYAIP